jgi:hypothetical protein
MVGIDTCLSVGKPLAHPGAGMYFWPLQFGQIIFVTHLLSLLVLVGAVGFEPTTPGSQNRCTGQTVLRSVLAVKFSNHSNKKL